MSLTYLSVTVLLVGIAALAAILFAMQRLRVRHRQLPVVTTLFWKEAVEEARARVFVQRFRHPLAYLLVLLIAVLLWFALAEPQLGAAGGEETVILVDGSAGMAWGNRFTTAVAEMLPRVDDAPRAHRQVYWCGSARRRLLAPGENRELLEKRLEPLQPEACPASVEHALRRVVAERDATRPLHIEIVGDAPVAAETLDLLPDDVRVTRIAPAAPLSGRPGNRGITGLGVTAARSGAWDRVDVFVEVLGENAEGATLTSSLVGAGGGRPLEATADTRTSPGRQRTVMRDVPADGDTLVVAVAGGDAFALDDEARMVLPRRPLIRVALSPSLEAVLGPVLSADPAVVIVQSDPTVAVGMQGEAVAEAVPVIEFVPASAQEDAILLHHERGLVSRDVLLESFNRLGLEEIDAVDLASTANVEISLGAAPAERRGITVWDALLGEDFNFVYSRSFPLFIARAIRWLVDERDFPHEVAVGETLPIAGKRVFSGPSSVGAGTSGTVSYDPAGAAFQPPLVGEYRDASGAVVAASLLDPWATVAGDDAVATSSVSDGEVVVTPLATLVILLVLGLLVLEWFLFRSGRIP